MERSVRNNKNASTNKLYFNSLSTPPPEELGIKPDLQYNSNTRPHIHHMWVLCDRLLQIRT